MEETPGEDAEGGGNQGLQLLVPEPGFRPVCEHPVCREYADLHRATAALERKAGTPPQRQLLQVDPGQGREEVGSVPLDGVPAELEASQNVPSQTLILVVGAQADQRDQALMLWLLWGGEWCQEWLGQGW